MSVNIVIIKLIVALLLFSVDVFCEPKPCVHRDYGADSTVCVCNATYCDTIGPVNAPVEGMYVVYTSSRDGMRFSRSYANFEIELRNNSDNLVTINANETEQVIYGWGGAFTDSAGMNIHSLNKTVQKHLLRSYFSKDGIEYSLCRVPIAGTDFSTRFYTYDDVPNDANLTHFKLALEDNKYKIPFIKKALHLSNSSLKLIGSAWCSPLWMKTNGKAAGLGFLKKEYYQTWADYHMKFLNAYKQHNITFWGLSTGNEPSSAFFPDFHVSNVGWVPWEQGTWVSKNFGPTIRNSEYSDMKIIAIDDHQFFALKWLILETLYNNADSYIDGIATHWYFNRFFSSPLRLTHYLFPGKFILGTEACAGDFTFRKKVSLGDWQRGELFAEDIISDMNQWVSSWLEWNLVLNEHGGPNYMHNYVDASIIVNATGQEFYKQTTYYVLGHFSKFVPPNSVKITTQPATRLVKIVAFRRPDNTTAVIVYNKQNENILVTIEDPQRGYIYFNAFNRSINTILYL